VQIRVGLFAGAAAALALAACSSSGGKSGAEWFEVRPMIMPGQHTTSALADPFGSLHVPATETAYAALSRTQQADLRAALRSVDCAHPPTMSGTSVRVVCNDQSDAYLLGAAIFNGNDVKDATPVPADESDPQWSIDLSLDSAAADRLFKWTSRHHVEATSGVFNDVQTSSRPPCGVLNRTQCSDFLAYISHDKVVSVPVTFAPVQSVVKVLGAFNEESATRLAHDIAG
jgi:preprotein translocase subunit SecD